MSLSANLFGRDSFIHRATNVLGLGIPGWLDKKFGAPETEGPRLSDLKVQTSTYGQAIPRVYGTIGISGNIIWLENNKLKEKVRKKKSGGKGGGSAEPTKTYSYSATFALGLCCNQIAGIRRIWCADKLIYNAGSDDLETIIASNQRAKGFRVYLGTDDQLPDPRIEAEMGVGNATAFRGIPYIVFDDFQLADYSDSLVATQFKVEVVTSADEPGMRYVLQANSNVQYKAEFVSGDVGLPYIYKVNGPDIQVAASGVSYHHLASGIGISEGATLEGLAEASGSGTSRKFPFARDENGFEISFTGYDRVFAPTDIKSVNSVGIVQYYIAPDFPDIYAMKVVGLACNTAATIFLAALCPSGEAASTSEMTAWVMFDRSGTTIRSGSGTYPDVNPRSNICMGRKAHTGSFNYYSSCLSIDGRYLYSAQGALTRDFEVFDTASNLDRVFISVQAFELGGSFTRPSIAEKDGIIYVVAGNYIWAWTASGSQSTDTVPLADILSTEVSLSSLIGSSDIDVSGVSKMVRGYRVSGGSIRSSLEPLQSAYPFDAIASGYKIKFVPRGQSSVMTIPWENLGEAGGDSSGDLLHESREMDTQLPAKTKINYIDAAREYDTNEQYAERINTAAVNQVERELAIVMTADEAAGAAEVLQNLAWLERNDYGFSLPPIYLALEPSDVVLVNTKDATYELLIREGNQDGAGAMELKAKASQAALYTPNATGGEVPGPDGTIGLAGASLFIPMDIPVVDETLQDATGFVGIMTGYADSWPGGLAVRSADGGQTWADLQAYVGKAALGTASTVLPASDGSQIDQRTLSVYMISGELESITRDQMLTGQNYAAYGVDGRWEIVRFQNAVLQVDGSYLLSGFVRGDCGTEWATGLHLASDYFILLDDPDNAFIGMAVGSIGVAATYRGITSGADIDSASDVPFTYQGVNLECLSPVYGQASRDGSGNISATFSRRSRLSSSWWTTGTQAPVGETTESYEVDVLDGATVVRTIATSSTTFSYSAADQTTDFGSAQSSILFRIYQLSEQVGRGYAYEVTL